MAFLIAAGLCASGWFGNTDAARSGSPADGENSRVRHAPRRVTVSSRHQIEKSFAGNRPVSTVPPPQVAAGISQPGSVTSEPSATVPGLVNEPPVPSAQAPHPSVAAALYINLTDEDFSKLSAHAQAAVVELGAYEDEAVQTVDSAPQAEGTDIAAEKNRLSTEADEYLRMSLGIDRFNELSFLAAANRHAQAAGLPADPASNME